MRPGAEPAEVEVGVAGLERVESPGDRLQPRGAGELPLRLLEPAAKAVSLLARDDTSQLRVEAEPSLDPPEKGKRNTGRAG